MSVYIKGMEMPTNCAQCACCDDDARFCHAAHKYIPMVGKPKFCPLVEAPTHDKRTETHGVCLDTVDRQAVEHLDWFTKLYCRDKSITDDLAFKCEQCEFEMPDGTCLVKVMTRKLCPDYKDFGAMGDL